MSSDGPSGGNEGEASRSAALEPPGDPDLALRRREVETPRWRDPLVVAVMAAAVAAFGNAAVTVINNASSIDLENRKAEQSRILEMIKTGDPDKAAENLRFLLDAGLIDDRAIAGNLSGYLSARKAGSGPALGAAGSFWKGADLREDVGQFSLAVDDLAAALRRGFDEIVALDESRSDLSAAADFAFSDGNGRLSLDAGASDLEAVVAPRMLFFAGLSEYGRGLAAIAGADGKDAILKQFDAAGRRFAAAAQRIAGTPDLNGDGAWHKVRDVIVTMMTEAHAILGTRLRPDDAGLTVKTVAGEMDATIQAGVAAFKDDIGDSASGGFASSALRMREEIETQEQATLLRARAGGDLSKEQLYRQVVASRQKIRRLEEAAASFRDVCAILDLLTAAHHELTAPSAGSTPLAIRRFSSAVAALPSGHPAE